MAIGFPAISAGSFTLTNDINGSEELSSVVQNLTGAEISTDGTKIFVLERNYTTGSTVVAGSGKVFQYTAPLGWENTGASPTYDNVSFNWTNTPGIHSYVNNGTTLTVRKLKFNSSGTRMYILDESDDLFQYNLTSAWDLSTASYSNNTINLGSQSTDMNSIMFNDTGTKMYALGGSDGKIYQYTLSSPFEISTATWDGSAADYIIPQYNSANPNPVDFSFNTDGTKLYILQGYGNAIHRYSLSVAYDTSTTTNDLVMDSINTSFYVGSGHPSGLTSIGSAYSPGFVFNQDGSYVIKLFNEYNSTMGAYITGLQAFAVAEAAGVGDGSTFTFNNRDYIYDGTKEAWEVNSPITVAQSGSPVSDLSELADSTSILNDPANEVLTYADLNAILAVTNPATGQLAFNLDTSDMYIFGGTNWQKVYDEDDVPPPFSFGGDRAIMNIGYSSVESYTGRLDYYDITTASNAQIFGDLTNANSNGKAGFSDSTYGVFAGGIISGGVRSTEIDYITISTTANAQSFGNLTVGRAGVSGCSDGTYGLAAGGDDGAGADSEVIDYVTIATPSNAIDFGDLQNATGRREMGSCSDATYGLWAGGYGSVYYDEVDYVTIQTPANAQSFGNLSSTRSLTAGVSDGTYGLFAGGFTVSGSVIFTNVIEYYTITSPSSATDFGDLSSNKRGHGAAGNATRATFAGGFNNDAGQQITTIEYVTVATPGNVTAFGDLTTNAYQAVGTSGNAA